MVSQIQALKIQILGNTNDAKSVFQPLESDKLYIVLNGGILYNK